MLLARREPPRVELRHHGTSARERGALRGDRFLEAPRASRIKEERGVHRLVARPAPRPPGRVARPEVSQHATPVRRGHPLLHLTRKGGERRGRQPEPREAAMRERHARRPIAELMVSGGRDRVGERPEPQPGGGRLVDAEHQEASVPERSISEAQQALDVAQLHRPCAHP